jgi:hypothetical protein
MNIRHARRSTCCAALALAAALSAFVSTAQAQAATDACGPADQIIENAYPQARRDADGTGYVLGDRKLMLPGQPSGDAPSMVCKVWPAHDELLLVAVPDMNAKESLAQDRDGNLDLLVVDRKTAKVLQRLALPDAMSDDAVRIESLEFDTARYVVAPGVQAFGLRTNRNGASRVNPFSETSLQLFTLRDGNAGPIRMVLDGLAVSRGTGEWDGMCAGSFSERKAVLAMTNDMHAGLADIRVSVTGEDTKQAPVGKKAGGDCKETTTKLPRAQHTLRYDGRRYVVPDALKAM